MKLLFKHFMDLGILVKVDNVTKMDGIQYIKFTLFYICNGLGLWAAATSCSMSHLLTDLC